MDKQTPAAPTKGSQSKYESLASYSLAALLVLLPLFFIPFSHVSFVYAKTGLVLLAVFVASVGLILNLLHERKIGVPSLAYLAVASALPISYLLLSVFSRDRMTSLIGQGTESDTFFFVTLCTILAVLVARFMRDRRRVLTAILGFLLVTVLVSLFHVLRYAFGAGFLSLGIFGTITSNTIGSFSDLGIFSGLAVILSILSLEFLSLSKSVRIGLFVSLGLSLVMVIVSNFYIVTNLFGAGIPVALTAILAFFSLVILAHKKVSSPKHAFPHITLVVFLVTLVCTVQAQPIAAALGSFIGVTQNEALDIRISPSGTVDVASKVMKSGFRNAVLGVGPNRFFAAWAAYKPTDPASSINSTAFWGTDFNLGFGYVPTALVTGGLLGSLAWLAVILLILYSVYALLRQMQKAQKDALTAYSALVASFGAVYLWIFAISYTPGPVILPLAFFFAGLLGALLLNEGIIRVSFLSWEKTGYWRSFGVVFGLVACIAVLVGAGYAWSNRAIASSYADRAVGLLQASNPDIAGAETLMAKAISLYPASSYLRFYSDIALARPLQVISKSGGSVPQSEITEGIAGDMYKAIAASEYAAFGKTQSLDYRDWIELGKSYEAATFFGATSTAARSAQAFAQAEALAPTSPLPPFLLGQLLAFAQQKDLAARELAKALALKPDYADASALLQALNGSGASQAAASLPSSAVQAGQAATSTQKAASKPALKPATTTKAKK